MTATRRSHTRRTPSGKRTRVRQHRVNTQTTAANLWEASGLGRLLSLDRGRNRAAAGIDAIAAGRRKLGALMVGAGILEIGAVFVGGASRAFLLGGLAAAFAGIGLIVNGYQPPKRKPARRPATRPVYQPAPAARGGKTSRRPAATIAHDRKPRSAREEARTAAHNEARTLWAQAEQLEREDGDLIKIGLLKTQSLAAAKRARELGPTDRGRRRTDEVI